MGLTTRVLDRDAVPALEQLKRVVTADVEERGEERRIGIDNGLGAVAHVNGDVLVEEWQMADVVRVMVRDEDAVYYGIFRTEGRESLLRFYSRTRSSRG